MQVLQEGAHGRGYDYRDGSPHLKHPRLYDRLADRIRAEVRQGHERGLPLDVLEIGAGDGAFVEPLLAVGAHVTATEMSRPAVDALTLRFGLNAAFDGVFDRSGDLEALRNRRFSVILYASVLHHIPDYVAAVKAAVADHLRPGGSLLAIQDPLWYPTLPRGVKTASDLMYLSWRVPRGDLTRGLASRVRRIRQDLHEDEPSDMVEYHVVRDGVDQDALRARLAPDFAHVEVESYWSAHAALWQTVGERVGLKNTFAIWATGYTPVGEVGDRTPTADARSFPPVG